MRIVRLFAIGTACCLLVSEASGQELYTKIWGSPMCRETYYSGMVPSQFQFSGGFLMYIQVHDWRRLVEPQFRQQVFEAAFRENLDFCRAKG